MMIDCLESMPSIRIIIAFDDGSSRPLPNTPSRLAILLYARSYAYLLHGHYAPALFRRAISFDIFARAT